MGSSSTRDVIAQQLAGDVSSSSSSSSSTSAGGAVPPSNPYAPLKAVAFKSRSLHLPSWAARRSPSLTASAPRSSAPSTTTCPPRALPPSLVPSSPRPPPPFTASWHPPCTRGAAPSSPSASPSKGLLGGCLSVCQTTELAGPPGAGKTHLSVDASPLPSFGGVSGSGLLRRRRRVLQPKALV